MTAFLSAEVDGGAKASTLGCRCAASKNVQVAAVHETLTESRVVVDAMRGIRRTVGTAKMQSVAATADRIWAMLAAIPDTLLGMRDRALLALGFAGAFRRSELVALNVTELDIESEGICATIRRSKTDQEGQGHTIAVLAGSRLRIVEAVSGWLEAAGISEGPVFRSVNRHGQILRTD